MKRSRHHVAKKMNFELALFEKNWKFLVRNNSLLILLIIIVFIIELTRKNAKYRTERAEHDKKIIEMARKYTETINQLVNEKHALMTMALNETMPSEILSQQ